MRYKIYWISKDRAQICCGVHATDDWDVVCLISDLGTKRGYEVRVDEEG